MCDDEKEIISIVLGDGDVCRMLRSSSKKGHYEANEKQYSSILYIVK